MLRAHTVKSYDEQMERLKRSTLDMGERSRSQLHKALQALSRHDHTIAQEIAQEEPHIDALQEVVDRLTVELLAMRQPVAIDLRIIVSSLKMASDLERIADNANNIARHVIHLNSVPLEKILESILALANHTLLMLDTVLESYRSMDIDKAKEVWHQDSETDRMYGALLGQLQKLMHDQSGSISDGTRLLGAAKCLERIGDHIQNIAESIHYIISADTYCGK